MGVLSAIEDLPWEDLRKAFDSLVASGQHPRDAAKQVAKLIDELVPLDKLVPGPLGTALEAVDGPLLRAAVQLGLRFSSRGVVPAGS